MKRPFARSGAQSATTTAPQPKARVPDLTEPQLAMRLKEHQVDRFHRDAALTSFDALFVHAGMIRASVAETRDAYKWVAAISTAAFFFVGQTIGPRADAIQLRANVGPLLAEFAFVLSILGAAAYLLVTDRAASSWLRKMYVYTSQTTVNLRQIDALAEELRDALEAKDLSKANSAFKATYAAKEALGEVMAAEPPDLPRHGRADKVFSFLCLLGLAAGVTLVALDQLVRLVL